MQTNPDPSQSPAHPLAYASPDIGDSHNQFTVTPVGWPLASFALVLTAISFCATSAPSGYFLLFLIAALGWVIAIGWWGIKTLLCLFQFRACSQVRHIWLKWPAAPVLLLITVIAVEFDAPAGATFWLARPCMERIARAQLLTPNGTNRCAYVGFYGLCRFSHDGNTITVEVTGAGFLDTTGFAYCPAGPPSGSGIFTPIRGPWYHWFLKF